MRRYFGEKWDLDNAEEKLLLTHDLTQDSVVFDVGGYVGKWAQEIVERYDPHMYIFEPVPEFCEKLRRKFKHNDKVKVLEYGLASDDGIMPVRVNGAASAVDSSGIRVCKFRRAVDAAIELLNVGRIDELNIDLMAINIEGGEYDLLPHIIQSSLIRQIRDLVVQFHPLWPSSYEQWMKIREQLNVWHSEVWNYPMCWQKHTRR